MDLPCEPSSSALERALAAAKAQQQGQQQDREHALRNAGGEQDSPARPGIFVDHALIVAGASGQVRQDEDEEDLESEADVVVEEVRMAAVQQQQGEGEHLGQELPHLQGQGGESR